MLFKASAPGSLMLLGEYAVLHGKSALVCAVDKRMTVTLTPRTDKKIILTSALGAHITELSQLEIKKPFQFVLATLKKFQKKIRTGCDIEIISEFSDKIGFASSAAVTVATLKVVTQWLELSYSKLELLRTARAIVRKVQGLGSGADVAACVFGGMIAYRAEPLSVEKILYDYPITVIYSGSKTPTVEAVAWVKHYFESTPKLFQQICQAIDQCVQQGKSAVNTQNWMELGKIMNIQQGLMDALGVNTPELNQIIQALRVQKNILGAKISGSGLGDCVIGLGGDDSNNSVKITHQGVLCEKN